MTIATLTSADLHLRDRVTKQLAWDSLVDADEIGVAARDDVVTLTGFVGTYAEKLAAERATKRVIGVRAVANDLQVRMRLARTDPEIAADAARALSMRAMLPPVVQAVVHDGHITLTGTVSTLFQRNIAERAVRHIKGVRNIVNRITVMAAPVSRDITRDIVRALHRDADVHARRITVSVNGQTVVLTGEVQSWQERDSADRAAAHAPGIEHVENLIQVVPTDAPAPERQDDDH